MGSVPWCEYAKSPFSYITNPPADDPGIYVYLLGVSQGEYISDKNFSITSTTEYVLQKAPTTPGFSLGSPCLSANLFLFSLVLELSGQKEESLQSSYLASISSGSTHSSSNTLKINSPSEEVDGQYINRCGS